MIPLFVIGCLVGTVVLLLLCLLFLPITLTIAYRENLTVVAKVLFVRIPLYPTKATKKGPHAMSAAKAERIRQKKAKKAAKKKAAAEEKKRKKQEKKEADAKKPKKSMSEILDTLSLIRQLVSVIVRRFFKHLRVRVARFKIKVATPDAATTAVAYGAVTQSINILLPILEEAKHIHMPGIADWDIQADFLSETPEADIKISFSLRVWHVLDIAVRALLSFFKRQFQKTDHSV